MLSDAALLDLIRAKFVAVEWRYDGLGGSVIRWTKEHGNTHDDPAHLVWVVDAEGKEVARARGEAESPSAFLKWLDDAHRAFERSRTRGIAQRFDPLAEGEDWRVPGARPRIVLFVPSAQAGEASADARAAITRAAALAKGALASRRLEEPARGWDLRRVEVGPPAEGGPPVVAPWAGLPRIVLVAAAREGADPERARLDAGAITVEALLAAMKRLAPTPTEGR